MRHQFETELLWLFFHPPHLLSVMHNIMQFNSVNLCMPHINVTLCLQSSREGTYKALVLIYHHHVLTFSLLHGIT